MEMYVCERCKGKFELDSVRLDLREVNYADACDAPAMFTEDYTKCPQCNEEATLVIRWVDEDEDEEEE